MPRSLWKGSISFGLVNIPVVLYSAENRNSFDLTLLDRRDMKPVGFKRYNKETGKEVAWDHIVKGYEYEKSRGGFNRSMQHPLGYSGVGG